jgi:hypothetical protein
VTEKKPTKARSKPRKVAVPAKQPAEPTHKERFERLLDDVVLGVPPKRR